MKNNQFKILCGVLFLFLGCNEPTKDGKQEIQTESISLEEQLIGIWKFKPRGSFSEYYSITEYTAEHQMISWNRDYQRRETYSWKLDGDMLIIDDNRSSAIKIQFTVNGRLEMESLIAPTFYDRIDEWPEDLLALPIQSPPPEIEKDSTWVEGEILSPQIKYNKE